MWERKLSPLCLRQIVNIDVAAFSNIHHTCIQSLQLWYIFEMFQFSHSWLFLKLFHTLTNDKWLHSNLTTTNVAHFICTKLKQNSNDQLFFELQPFRVTFFQIQNDWDIEKVPQTIPEKKGYVLSAMKTPYKPKCWYSQYLRENAWGIQTLMDLNHQHQYRKLII